MDKISPLLDSECLTYAYLGRNIFLLTLIIDDVDDDELWDIYYHLYIDDDTTSIVLKQAEKLLPLLQSPKTWNSSQYGKTLKFCDVDTLQDVQRICERIARSGDTGTLPARREDLADHLKRSKAIFHEASGGAGTVMTGMRSAAPLSLQSQLELPKAFDQYWKDGTVTPKEETVNVPNPMLAALLSETEILHYGTDPVLGFHLATAYAPLVDQSPLKPDDDEDNFKAAAAAKVQFSEWVSALRHLLKKNMVLRFVVSDVFAFCHSLQHAATSNGESANWFRRQWDIKPLKLDSESYGTDKTGSALFDMIDTSNLSDHFGPLNMLVATAPLLTTKAWATVYTELLLKREGSEKEAFDKLLCGHAATMSLLLGVLPVQYWTNAKAESHVDEVFMGLMGKRTKGNDTQLHTRIAWKRDDQFSGQPNGRGSLHFEPTTLSRLLYKVYLEMFRSERLENSLEYMGSRAAQYSNFHRGSFAVFLKSIKNRVTTEWFDMCADLLDKIATDRTLGLSSNYMQELGAQLYMLGVVKSQFLNDASTRPETGILKGWIDIPPVVAVTLAVSRQAISRLFSGPEQSRIASPTLIGSLKSGPGSASQWHNMYGNVQIVFGHVKTEGSRTSEDSKVMVEQDPLGWEGSSDLIASFYVPASALQVEPERTLVGLHVMPTGQSMMIYSPVLGHDMTVFESSVKDESRVYVSQLMPGQQAHQAASTGIEPLKGVIENNGDTKTKLVADIPASESHISTLTGHLDIISEKGKKLLKDKTPIELRQKNPFIIDIVFSKDGKDVLSYPVGFPVPVTKDGSRTRIARTSGYIEVIAPLAEPASSECLADFLFPTSLTPSRVPAALNTPHVNLDRLPVLDLERKKDMRWLTTLTSFQFTTREKSLRDGTSSSGIAEDARVNFKESLFTMFMLASGLQGGQTGLFAINHPERGGIHMLIFVSALRLDGDTASVVLDAAVIPFTTRLIESGRMEDFLLILRTLECCSTNVNDTELVLWKKVLPSLAERCRTWSHRSNCEYKRKGATIPLSLDHGQQVLCSCGNGKLPDNYMGIPEWETAAPNAVRIAISPTYAVPFVEEVVDTSTFDKSGPPVTEGEDRCRSCGKTSTADGGALKKCSRCHEVKYCSAQCQKKDWKTHRAECKEA